MLSEPQYEVFYDLDYFFVNIMKTVAHKNI